MKGIKQVNELLDLLLFLDLNVVLLKTVKSELALVVDKDFEGIAQELAANVLDFLRHGSREHHHLFLGRSGLEDCLNITSHVYTINLVEFFLIKYTKYGG